MTIFIRHSSDERSDNDTTIDTSLTDEGREYARKVGRYLCKKFGIPDEIRTSPFVRCRQTAEELVKYAQRKGYHVKIRPDPNLCRLTTGQRAHVRRDTAMYGDVLLETKSEFKRRVTKKCERALQKHFDEGKVVWNVSHALVIKRAARLYGIASDGYVEPCAWVDIATTQSSL